jgi:hypothetical protein
VFSFYHKGNEACLEDSRRDQEEKRCGKVCKIMSELSATPKK